MTIEHGAEWWRGVDESWDELVALLKGCTLTEQRTGTATSRHQDAQVVRRLIGTTRATSCRSVRPLARAA